MSFGREKRLLLGLLALLAPLPLPFNDVVGWPVAAVYALAVAAFLRRAWRPGEERWLPPWAANVAAVAYLPVFAADLLLFSRGVLVGPVVRLGLYALVVKLFSLRRERDKWQAVLGIFFVFLAAVATSVHLSVALFLVVFLAVALLLLSRFALFHLLIGFGRRDSAGLGVPLAAFLTSAVLVTVVLAVPLFAVLPRVRSPYIYGVGGRGLGTEITATGFSDEVSLDSIGRVRSNHDVALRLQYDVNGPPPEIRLKGGAFDHYDGRSWRRAAAVGDLRSGSLRLVPGDAAVGRVEIFLQPLDALGLPLPVETVRLEVPRRGLRVDRGGAVRLTHPVHERLRYEVAVTGRPVSGAAAPAQGLDTPSLDLTGVTPRMAALARRVAGSGPAPERARRLERYLRQNYEYSLDLVGGASERPIDDFLFVHRRGHCEYFATALVLLLRAEGIPARLVAGFLGAEKNPLGYYAVRQSNAHAWVEAYLPPEGWATLDPTPPAGRPGVGDAGALALARQLYDSLSFGWDRYVLTYGVEDQWEVLRRSLGAVLHLWRSFRHRDEPAGGAVESTPATPAGGAAAAPAAVPRRGRWTLTLALVLSALVLAALLWRRYRAPLTATRAYRLLRETVEGTGVPVGDATGPLAFEHRLAARFAAAADPTRRLMGLYLRESFGGEELDDGEREDLREALGEARRLLREAARRAA